MNLNRSFVRFISATFIAAVICAGNLHSQEITNPESEYFRIRTMAFAGELDSAATAARKLVNAFPSYGDARILLGRILAWKHDYENAAAVIDTLLLKEPDNADALSAKRDITLWSKENTAVATDIRAGYQFDQFSQPYSRFWQVFKAGAGHKFSWGQASAGVNIGHVKIGDPVPDVATEVQIEAEAWPHLSKKNYAFLAYAFSPGTYFPRHRGAVEVWQVLPAGWALSAGMNYYYFDRNAFIALASVEKYIRQYWFSVKGFVYFKDDGPTTSFYVNARRYFGNIDYLQITLGTGTAPDEPFDIQADLARLSATSIRLAWNSSLTDKLVMRLGAGYSREEYDENERRNRFEGGVSFIYALRMK
ncbi:MAG: YaiO family outer membrane beta-barrel protein [Bacteroidales bacterium]|nr:YaiO family outer membrane beta-barrel protein [Bacteroidales bacterium]